jgi:hypothetical protein
MHREEGIMASFEVDEATGMERRGEIEPLMAQVLSLHADIIFCMGDHRN